MWSRPRRLSELVRRMGVSAGQPAAASFSVTAASQWALDVLIDAGFRYDSSVFPIRHDRYGLPGASPVPFPATWPTSLRCRA